MRLASLLGLLLLFLLTGASASWAQTPLAPQALREQTLKDVSGADGMGADGPMQRIGYALVALHRAHTMNLSQTARTSFEAGLPVHAGTVAVTALARPAQTEALYDDLIALGLQRGARAGRLVSGRLPIVSLRKAARLSTLHSAWPALAVTRIGRTTSQGVPAMQTDALRNRLGTQGDGVRVGVLSDTYDNADSVVRPARTDVQSGDLPGPGNPNGFTTPVRVLQEGTSPGSDEGRALLQIVHDVAPAAQLSFHNATDGIATFVNGIRALADAGASVIADDVLFLAEPMFQDGLIAQAIDDVHTRDDVLYVSSAGNNGRDAYQSPFRSASTTGPAGGEAHDFDPGPGVDATQTITLPVDATLSVGLHWDQPVASAGGPGATSDLEVSILDRSGNVLALERRRNVGGNPFAFATLTNNGSIDANGDGVADSTFQVAIERLEGPRPSRMAYVAFARNGSVTLDEWATNSPTLYGHPNARGALAVGAAAFFNTPAFNTTPPRVNSFSSVGGIPILFDPRGQRLATPERRSKPEFTAPDGGNTTFFGQLLNDGDTFPNFFGTSAAVAHAAGLAALLRAAHPDRTADAVADALQESAIDIERTSDGVATGDGFDPFSGAGLVDGSAVMLDPARVNDFAVTASGAEAATVRWTVTDATIESLTLERSFEGAAFVSVLTETAPTGTFDVAVDDLAVGTHTFRLRWTLADGRTEVGPSVQLVIPLRATVSLGDPYPNPTDGAFRFTVTVREEQQVSLALYDVIGRFLGFVFTDVVRPDRPRIVEVRADQTDRFSSGLYFVRAIGEAFDTAVPFRIVR